MPPHFRQQSRRFAVPRVRELVGPDRFRARGQVQDSILSTPLARKLAGLRLDEDIAVSVLAEMQMRFGQGLAWELARAPWLLEWARWQNFVEEVQVAAGSWSEGLLVFHVKGKIEELLFALQRVVMAQQPRPERSNDAALNQLLAAGLERRDGKVWGENDCLADSLLQLLIFHGVVPDWYRSSGSLSR